MRKKNPCHNTENFDVENKFCLIPYFSSFFASLFRFYLRQTDTKIEEKKYLFSVDGKMRVITINLQKEMNDLKRILTKKHLFYANFFSSFCFPRICYVRYCGDVFGSGWILAIGFPHLKNFQTIFVNKYFSGYFAIS